MVSRLACSPCQVAAWRGVEMPVCKVNLRRRGATRCQGGGPAYSSATVIGHSHRPQHSGQPTVRQHLARQQPMSPVSQRTSLSSTGIRPASATRPALTGNAQRVDVSASPARACAASGSVDSTDAMVAVGAAVEALANAVPVSSVAMTNAVAAIWPVMRRASAVVARAGH